MQPENKNFISQKHDDIKREVKAVLRQTIWIMVVALCLSACGQLPAETEVQTKATTATPVEMTTPTATEPTTMTVDPAAMEQEAEAMEQTSEVVSLLPSVEAPGVLVKSGGGAFIDYSNTTQGYVVVRFDNPTQQRLKVQVKGPKTTYTYNLPVRQWTAFPLSDENGSYQVVVYENISGNKYATVLSLHLEVVLEDEFAPFLHGNQYVDYDNAPNTVAKAAALTAGIADPLARVAAIYDYVISTLTYDQELAANVQSGYLPDLDAVLERKTGICFDYAALMTGMLRSQGVPAKLVVGYAGEAYHAWISVWTEETGWVDGVIYFDGKTWQRMDPTFASSAGASQEIMDYIGNGSNYRAKYFY